MIPYCNLPTTFLLDKFAFKNGPLTKLRVKALVTLRSTYKPPPQSTPHLDITPTPTSISAILNERSMYIGHGKRRPFTIIWELYLILRPKHSSNPTKHFKVAHRIYTPPRPSLVSK